MNHSNTLTALSLSLLLAATPCLAADKFEIDLKELRPAAAAKPAPGPQSLEIDLKELGGTKAKKSKSKSVKRKPDKSEPAVPASVVGNAERSSYVIRSGEHLALVLVQHYGLTEVEARRLMPEIMRINGISSPQKISVGQKLIIPLPYPADKPSEKAVAATQTSAERSAETIAITYSDACSFAAELAEKLGLLVTPPSLEVGGKVITARHEALSVTLACDATPAEAFTYQRLLTLKGEQLMLLGRKDPAGLVLEKLAGHLGLKFMVPAPTVSQAGQQYLFSATASGRSEKVLNIFTAAP
jgi:hypothetical protein